MLEAKSVNKDSRITRIIMSLFNININKSRNESQISTKDTIE